ncbi:MAG: type II secretion system F family protein [Synergistaceae bacterium]|jgi:type II secretory pathway component PulF|nr:type II secretion system F family protein [Synergistaceae bacterium]
MPRFRITAYDSRGSQKTLRLDAAGEDEVLRELSANGYIPISLKMEQVAETSGTNIKGVKKLSAAEQYMFCSMTSAFLRSGLSLTEILGILQKQTRDKKMSAIYGALRESVESGRSLAQSMRLQSVFRDSLIGIVDAGERSSLLPEVLEKAAVMLRSEISVRRKIQSALTYPALMLIVGLCVVTFLVIYVVPQMTDIVVKAGRPLPLATKILLMLSSVVKYGGIPVVGALAAVYFTAKKRGKSFSVPFFREVKNHLTISLVFAQLSALIKSGVPLVQALEMSENMDPVKGRMQRLADLVKRGYRFSQSLEREGSYSEDIAAIVRIGEGGANLPDCLDRIAENSWEFAQTSIQKWSSLAEPIIIIVLGVAVGFVVMAVLLPIFSLSDLASL